MVKGKLRQRTTIKPLGGYVVGRFNLDPVSEKEMGFLIRREIVMRERYLKIFRVLRQ